MGTFSFDFFQLNDIPGRALGTAMQMHFLAKWLLQEKSLLVVGPTGPGEALQQTASFRQSPREKYVLCQIKFAVQTSAKRTQDISLTELERYPEF